MGNKDIRKKTLEKAKRIVVKVGSSILASPEKGLHHEVFSNLAKEISELKRQGYEIVNVSSMGHGGDSEKVSGGDPHQFDEPERGLFESHSGTETDKSANERQIRTTKLKFP
jgi:hypothetical protein